MTIELDDTEKKIVEATFNIAQRDGITKATTKRIAKEAGVNEVTIFRRFENKKNLIEITKNYYFEALIAELNEIFDYDEDDEIEDYLQSCFFNLSNLPEDDFSVIKIALREVKDEEDKKLLISHMTRTTLNKFQSFFDLQIEKGNIRKVDTRVLGTMCFSLIFQSVVIQKTYGNEIDMSDRESYSDGFWDILLNGIKVQ